MTRHLQDELSASDWDVSILHYLGLDHIGHLRGPSSHLIPDKLQEMSDVIETVYDALSRDSSPDPPLLLVLGDHGMSDAGSHGGASVAEVMTPIVALSPGGRIKKTQVNKIPYICPSICKQLQRTKIVKINFECDSLLNVFCIFRRLPGLINRTWFQPWPS